MKTITISYDGGGWTHPYAAGFTKYIQQNKHIFPPNTHFRYTGISAGSCVALAAALDIPMDTLFQQSLKWSKWCRMCPLLTTRAVRNICNTLIHSDNTAQQLTTFAVNTTILSRTFKPSPNIIHKFKDKKHLTDTMVATCTLPLLNHLPLNPFGQHLYDGGLSHRFFDPPWPTDIHIKVSPWKHRHEATHKPEFQIPWYRLIFPYTEDQLTELYNQGFKDAADFFNTNNDIKVIVNADSDNDTTIHPSAAPF